MGESGGDGAEVLAEEGGELGDRENVGLLGLADPGGQQLASAVADEVREGSGEVSGLRDVRAGEAGLVEVLDLLGARRSRLRMIHAVVRRGLGISAGAVVAVSAFRVRR
ncbi:hypothetical protein [Streptomyces sp. PAN_FS17]|uniref:hypothetical protein n=1 Tax=Streptomyces sp. PAN_FS17 TaxID=1855351 RepID=UPI000B82EE59|nr:hypothetical protein [Streptomyces sp. PAN_FS17]